ncbi:hypothetical protein AFLA_006259 [Aspergillus flavus NRRL3357]|nr:hypothetical protein AFLA_006259 [Aspergillus flavus NRRL3357]
MPVFYDTSIVGNLKEYISQTANKRCKAHPSSYFEGDPTRRLNSVIAACLLYRLDLFVFRVEAPWAPSRSDAAEFGAPSTSPATALHWMGWAYRNAYTLMSQVLWLMGNFQKAPGGLKIVKAFGICTTVLPFTIDTQARFGDELEERFGSWSRHLFSLVSAFNCFFLTMLAVLLLLVGTIQVHAGWVLILHYIIFSVVVTVISFGARLPRDQPTGVNTVKDIMKGIAMGCYMSTALVIPALIVFLQEPDSPGSDVITYIRCEPLALWRKFIAIFP